MTILAQTNDCHSCNDARSIVQKKKFRVLSKKFVGEVIWSCCALGFQRNLFWVLCFSHGSGALKKLPSVTTALVMYSPGKGSGKFQESASAMEAGMVGQQAHIQGNRELVVELTL